MRKLGMLVVTLWAWVGVAGAVPLNLVPNAGFESWDNPNTPTDWTYENGITVDQESGTVFQGTYSAKVTLTTTNQSSTDFESALFPVEADSTYDFSFWVLDNDPAGNARLVVRWFRADSSYITANYGAFSSDDAHWQEVSGSYTAPSDAAFAKFGLRFYDVSSNWDGDAVFYIDSLVATKQAPTIYEVTIEEIQGTGDTSPYEGEKVKTSGTVTAVFNRGFFMEMNPGGARRGIYVYLGSTPSVNVGDSLVIEQADVTEYNGLTELTNPVITVVGSGYNVPGPTRITLADFGEDYEGVFVMVSPVKVADENLGYGEWLITDGSNTGRVDDMGNYTYVPTEGDSLYYVLGPLTYTYGNYKMEPRDDGDIAVANYAPDTVSHTEASDPNRGVIVSITWNDPDGNIVDDSLYYRVDAGAWTAVYHDSVTTSRAGGTYWYTIPPQTSGTTLEYYGIAIDDLDGRNVTDTYTTTPVAVAEAEAITSSRVSLNATLVRNHLEVAFSLPQASQVRVVLFNAAGQQVRTLWQGMLPAGEHVRRVPVHLNSGVYLVAAQVEGHTVATHRVVIVR